MTPSNSKAAAILSTMPPLRHSLLDKEFNIRDSEALKWILDNDEMLNWIWNRCRYTERIVYSKETGTWQGVERRSYVRTEADKNREIDEW